MRRALLVGIDHYDNFNDLSGCVNDARALHPLLERNEDRSLNLDCEVIVGAYPDRVTRDELLEKIQALAAPGADLALLYFAGHGSGANGDVSLVTSDAKGTMMGVRFTEVLEEIARSKVQEGHNLPWWLVLTYGLTVTVAIPVTAGFPLKTPTLQTQDRTIYLSRLTSKDFDNAILDELKACVYSNEPRVTLVEILFRALLLLTAATAIISALYI